MTKLQIRDRKGNWGHNLIPSHDYVGGRGYVDKVRE